MAHRIRTVTGPRLRVGQQRYNSVTVIIVIVMTFQAADDRPPEPGQPLGEELGEGQHAVGDQADGQ